MEGGVVGLIVFLIWLFGYERPRRKATLEKLEALQKTVEVLNRKIQKLEKAAHTPGKGS